jgi:uncharacterized repeat protein (TIGR01451 family)
MRVVLTLALALATFGCVRDLSTRTCAADGDCLLDGARGTCAPAPHSEQRYCVFASSRCAGGAWSFLAGEGLADTCYGQSAGPDAGPGRVDAGSVGGDGGSGGVHLEVDPPTLDFGAVSGNGAAPGLSVSVAVAGLAPGEATSNFLVTVVGDDAASFTIGDDTCSGAPLTAGARCMVTVKFVPATSGSKKADLAVAAQPGGLLKVSLRGTRLLPTALVVSPASYPFATAQAGAPGEEHAFSVRNSAETPTAALSAMLAVGADFTITDNGCTMPLAGLASCTIKVRFQPAGAGAKNDSLIINDGAGGAATAQLSGEALTGAVLSFGPGGFDFGATVVDAPGATTDFTLTNGGGTATGVPLVSLPAGSGFTIADNGCTMPLPASGQCVVRVGFTPGAPVGPKAATLSASASPGGTATAMLSGVALAAGALGATPTARSFGSIALGAASDPLSVEIKNTGGASVDGVGYAITGNDAPSFAIASNDCTATLAVGETCHLGITFTPKAVGPRTASLTATSALGNVAVGLDGTGTASLTVTKDGTGGGTVRSLPAGIDCGPTCGATFADAMVTLSATPDANSKLVAWKGGGCSGSGDCTVAFDAAKSVTATFDLRPAALSVTPNAQDFGSAALGASLGPLNFTVRNTGGSPTSTLAASADDSSFHVSGPCVGATLAAGAPCTLSVTFNPAAPSGPKSATLTVSAQTGGSAMAQLTGTALSPGQLAITPTSFDFQLVPIGSASAEMPFTVKNTGQSDTGTLTIGVSDATNFTVSSNPCPTTLPAGQSCTVGVKMTPGAVGPLTGASLTASAQPGGNAAAGLSGTGSAQVMVSNGGGGTVSGGGGAIDCGTTCSATFTAGPVSLTAMPDGTHTFSSWSGACTGSGACNVPLDAAIKMVGATFASLPSADVGVTGGAAASVLHGQDLATTWTVTNHGPDPASSTSLSITLPASTSYTSVTTSKGTCSQSSGTVTCSIGSLANAATATVTVHVNAATVGTAQHSATVSATELDPASSNNTAQTSTSIDAAADLAVTSVTGSPDPVNVGANLTYSVALKNNGPDAASAALSDTLPASTTFVSATPSQGAACTHTGSPVVVSCALGSLASGATATVSIVVTAGSAGTLSNSPSVSSATGDPTASNNSATAMTTVSSSYTLHIVRTGSGSVSTSDGMSCTSSTCDLVYPAGTSVGLTAKGAPGASRFDYWWGVCSGAGGVRTPGASDGCTVTMDANKTVQASFASYTHNLAFVSSATYASNLGGARAYDTKCNLLATAAGIDNGSGGGYIAWMSDETSSFAVTALGSATGFLRVDGNPWADQVVIPAQGSDPLHSALDIDENGRTHSDSVWTGTYYTTGNGIATRTCSSWTGSGQSATGKANLGPGWWSQNNSNDSCSTPHRIYCIMTSKGATAPVGGAVAGKYIYQASGSMSSGTQAVCDAGKPAGAGTVKPLVATKALAASDSGVLVGSTTYKRPDGTLVGTGDEIIAGTLHNGIWQLGNGGYLDYSSVMTGSTSITAQATASTNCNDWADSAGTVDIGDTQTSAWWYSSSTACSSSIRILCVEQ